MNKSAVLILTALFVFLFTVIFLFDIFRVNNLDMRPNFEYGDAVLIQKSFYKIKHQDIILFKCPLQSDSSKATRVLQRVLGIAGDTLEIKNKSVFVNGIVIHDSFYVNQNYIVSLKKNTNDNLWLLNHKNLNAEQIDESLEFGAALTIAQGIELKGDSAIDKLIAQADKRENFDEEIFPYVHHLAWNKDFFGKLYIPKKNDTLQLDTNNIHIYESIISDYEKNNLELKHDSIFINSVLTNTYLVKQNYYFVLGDNRGNAIDSRYWGFLPERNVIGKFVLTLRRTKI